MANLSFYLHTYTGQFYDFFLLFSLPRGRNRGKLNASVASVPTYARVGAGVGLAGSSPGLRPCLRAGGIGDQGTTLTHDPILTRPTLDALENPY
jgi:hypothetical protein